MTNKEKFIEIFGIDVWKQMIVFIGCAEQFKEFWTSKYYSMEGYEIKDLSKKSLCDYIDAISERLNNEPRLEGRDYSPEAVERIFFHMKKDILEVKE